jgi:crotonobetainyl-CoA hydratase
LALACDLIVASDNASFALPEPKVGWAALGGGVQRLPRAIGMKRAMGIILTGRTVLATEGLDLGFVNEVVPVSNLLSAARAWALQIVACAPLAVRCSKEVTYKSADIADLAGAMNIANYTTPKSVFESVDAVEGKRAFVERRPPVWKGR